MSQPRLTVVPVTLKEAQAFVRQHHRAIYGACRRVAQAMGFRKILTYTLVSEPGTSLLATGWAQAAQIKGKTWDTSGRRRVDKHPTQDKFRWETAC